MGKGKRHEYAVAPARELKWGSRLLAIEPPEDELGRLVLEAVRSGCTMRQLSVTLGTSWELTHYYVKRLVERDQARKTMKVALDVLEGNLAPAHQLLTTTQIEAVRIMLAGASQQDAGDMLGITQAAVSSRVRLARKALRTRGGAWARAVLDGLETGTRNVSRFQLKGLGTSGRRPWRCTSRRTKS